MRSDKHKQMILVRFINIGSGWARTQYIIILGELNYLSIYLPFIISICPIFILKTCGNFRNQNEFKSYLIFFVSVAVNVKMCCEHKRCNFLSLFVDTCQHKIFLIFMEG